MYRPSPTTADRPSGAGRRLVRAATGGLAALTLGLTAGLAAAPVASAAAAGADAADRATAQRALTRTEFAFRANGYGTSARGGEVPVGSDRTALSSIACTSLAGKVNRNFVAESEVPGLGTVRGVSSRVTTTRKDGVTASTSVHKVAEVILAESQLGRLTIDGVVSRTRAANDGRAFDATAETQIAGITFTPAAGPPQTLPIPSPGQPVEIPGVAVLTVGRTIEKETRENARAYAVGLTIKVVPTDTVVKLARSAAKLERGFKTGIFQGSGVPVKANVLGELAQVGRVITQVMPCVGTGGQLVEADAADVDLGEQVLVDGASARQKGEQDARRATGMESSSVAELNVGDQLVVEAIRSRVEVTRLASGKLSRRATASLGSITLGGEPQSLDELGELEIPGVAKIQTGLRKKIEDGIRMIGVRITLLDGTGAVIDLATSKLAIRGS